MYIESVNAICFSFRLFFFPSKSISLFLLRSADKGSKKFFMTLSNSSYSIIKRMEHSVEGENHNKRKPDKNMK